MNVIRPPKGIICVGEPLQVITSQRYRVQVVKLTAHFGLMRRLRMNGALLAFHPCVFPGQLYLCLYLAIVDSVCIYKFNYRKFEGHVSYIWQFTSYHVASPLQTLKVVNTVEGSNCTWAWASYEAHKDTVQAKCKGLYIYIYIYKAGGTRG